MGKGRRLFAVALVVFAFLLIPVVQLLQNGLQLVRDRQADVGRVFQQTQALVGEVEGNYRTTQCTAGADSV